jgi:hypothetical protein
VPAAIVCAASTDATMLPVASTTWEVKVTSALAALSFCTLVWIFTVACWGVAVSVVTNVPQLLTTE